MSEAKIWLCRLHWIYTYENNSRIIAKSLYFLHIIMELPIWTIKSRLHLKQKDWQRVISDFFSTYSLASTTLWCTAFRLPAVITTRTRFSWASSCSWAPSSFHTTWRSLELRLVWIFKSCQNNWSYVWKWVCFKFFFSRLQNYLYLFKEPKLLVVNVCFNEIVCFWGFFVCLLFPTQN